MTTSTPCYILVFLVSLFARAHVCTAVGDSATYHVVAIEVRGAERTNIDWVKGYLGYKLPVDLDDQDAREISLKLLTTAVFRNVSVGFSPLGRSDGDQVLVIEVVEKWTFIPVLRGVYGGGTPLRVVGAYDTHAAGRLLTLGGELRKYGEAPAGYVFYARSPRHASGRFFLGAEFWRDFHRRTLYDENARELGVLGTDATIVRAQLLMPLVSDWSIAEPALWKYGLDVKVVNEAPTSFDRNFRVAVDTVPAGIRFLRKDTRSTTAHFTLVYDDVVIDNLRMNGLRLIGKGGPFYEESERSHSSGEADGYLYKLLPMDLNLAAHMKIGASSADSPQTHYFLGGFDSIRGLPDGIVHGTRAGYANLEIRKLFMRFKYVHMQTVAFVDGGLAGNDWTEARDMQYYTAGAGLRLAIPQVYRLMFRVDYAWSIDGRGFQGVTAGMNQLFQPYSPL